MCDWSEFVREYCLRSLDTSSNPVSGLGQMRFTGIVSEILLFLVCFHLISTLGESFMSPAFESLSLRRGGLGEVVASVFISITLSLPETTLSFVSAIKGEFSSNHSLAISTILGSGWISLLLIPGIVAYRSAVEFPGIIIARELVFYGIMLMLLQRAMEDDLVTIGESLTLLSFYVMYFLSVSVTQSIERKQRTERRRSRVLVQLAPLQNALEETELLERAPIEMALSHEFNSGIEPVSLPRPPFSESLIQSDATVEDFLLRPLHSKETVTSKILSFVCVRAVPGTDSERLYMLSLINVFAIQLFLSSVITAVSNRWIEMVSVDHQSRGYSNLIGSVVVGLFSKLTDILQALSISSPFAGYHIVISSLSSQMFAVGVGLGLTWFINGAIKGGTHIDNSSVRLNVKTGLVGLGILSLYSILNLDEGKIKMKQPRILIFSYVALVAGFIILSLE